MTISGETIDYGPCAFMEAYDPATVYSSIDHGGRYAYGNQPVVAAWNLARFGEALLPLIDADQDRAVELATESLGGFRRRFDEAWLAGMRAKLGLPEGFEVGPLAEDLLTLMREGRADHTAFFRDLATAARGDADPARAHLLDLTAFEDWLARWRAVGPDAEAMDRVNPVYVPRNHLVEEALAAAVNDDDLGPLERLVDAVTGPFDARPGLDRYAAAAPPDFGAYRTFCGT
jgi:uncharacterized protein YdiU (UPF0061 family)